MKSRVHPKYKTKYRVGNWPEYDRALVQRGDITVWLAPDAIATWEAVGVGTRGGQLQYSDLAIETALTLRLLFHLPLRQTEGFLTSIFWMLGLDLSAPDHTTLSRRGQHLDLMLRRASAGAGMHLIVDSTGLSIVGEGEWAAAKHGGRGRRGWKKLHLGVDRSGVIVAQALTEGHVDDATTGITLIEARRRRPRQRDGGCRLRHDRRLRDRGGAGRDGRGATGQDGERVSPRPAVGRSGPDDQVSEAARTAPLEEGLGVPSAGAGGERVLPIQVDHRGWPSSQEPSRAGK